VGRVVGSSSSSGAVRSAAKGKGVRAGKAALKAAAAAAERETLARALPPSFGLGTSFECFDAYVGKGGGSLFDASGKELPNGQPPSLGITLKNIEGKAVVRGFAPWRLRHPAQPPPVSPSTAAAAAAVSPSSPSLSGGAAFSGVLINGTEVRVNDVIVAVNNFDARGEAFSAVMGKLKDTSGPGSDDNALVCVRFARPTVDAAALAALEGEAKVSEVAKWALEVAEAEREVREEEKERAKLAREPKTAQNRNSQAAAAAAAAAAAEGKVSWSCVTEQSSASPGTPWHSANRATSMSVCPSAASFGSSSSSKSPPPRLPSTLCPLRRRMPPTLLTTPADVKEITFASVSRDDCAADSATSAASLAFSCAPGARSRPDWSRARLLLLATLLRLIFPSAGTVTEAPAPPFFTPPAPGGVASRCGEEGKCGDNGSSGECGCLLLSPRGGESTLDAVLPWLRTPVL